MPTGYTSSFKLCTILTLPLILDSMDPPQVRVLARVIGCTPGTGLYLVAEPTGFNAQTVLLDVAQLALEGGVFPPKVKDLIMVFGELVHRDSNDEEQGVPSNEISILTVQPPDATLRLVAKRLVQIEEGHGGGFDLHEWSKAVEVVQSHRSNAG
ncbi:hypothetical protein JCM16303_000421 [Sporobolomyces ruberrimus]